MSKNEFPEFPGEGVIFLGMSNFSILLACQSLSFHSFQRGGSIVLACPILSFQSFREGGQLSWHVKLFEFPEFPGGGVKSIGMSKNEFPELPEGGSIVFADQTIAGFGGGQLSWHVKSTPPVNLNNFRCTGDGTPCQFRRTGVGTPVNSDAPVSLTTTSLTCISC